MGFDAIEWGSVVDVKCLGSGGMAELFLMKRVQGDFVKSFVIKRMHPHLANDPNSRALFAKEAKTHSFFDHPFVVQLFDYGLDVHFLYMALEYVEGVNLFSLAQQKASQTESERALLALKALGQIGSALTLVHRYVIHQDLSPTNILYSDHGYFKLCDFGLAKEVGAAPSSLHLAQGTIRYMPPEQIGRGETDQRSDIFSLAATIAEFYVGKKLYGDLETGQLAKLIRNGDYLKHFKSLNLPKRLDQIILRAVQPSPQDRFQSADELVDAVQFEEARMLVSGTRAAVASFKSEDPKALVHSSKVHMWSRLVSLLLAVPILLFIPWFAQWRSARERSPH